MEDNKLHFRHSICDVLVQLPRENPYWVVLGTIEGNRRRGWQRTRWLDGITDAMGMSLSKLWKIVEDRGSWCAAVHGITKSHT